MRPCHKNIGVERLGRVIKTFNQGIPLRDVIREADSYLHQAQ